MTATESITKTLGSGSGVDLRALVASLVNAQYSVKNAQLTTKAETLTAQISGVAKLKSAITGFDSALKALIKGGTLSAQPTSSQTGVLTVSAAPGGKASGSPVQLTVNRLASAQAATTDIAVDRAAAFRTGTLTVRIGTEGVDNRGRPTFAATSTTTIDITSADATLDGIAAKINASNTGLTATVINDGDGARLTVKGATGVDKAFEITGADNGGAGLSLATLSVGRQGAITGTTIGATAADASVTLDGATFTRSTNSFSDLVAGVKIDLVSTSTTPVTIGATSPASGLSQAVTDFVETYNQMRAVILEETNTTDGVLRADSMATGVGRAFGQLTTMRLATSPDGGPQTLADIGVRTNRDGTLSIDSARLTAVLAKDPKGVEALFADGTGATNGGLSAAFSAIAARLTDKQYGLDAAAGRYTRLKSDVADAQMEAADASAALSTRLTQQFAAMDARVAAYKSTQAFLTNQIAAWNAKD